MPVFNILFIQPFAVKLLLPPISFLLGYDRLTHKPREAILVGMKATARKPSSGPPDEPVRDLQALNDDIVACERCPRLRRHCRDVAALKKRAHRDEVYWGRPVPSFGDPRARLLIVGLAPAAHGANRTGRMFTGDSSGNWLYRALHAFGFASRPDSTSAGDGLRLRDVWITAVNHCAPPANKPSPAEQAACRPFLAREIVLLKNLEIALVLGRIAFDGLLRALAAGGNAVPRPKPEFGHGIEISPFGDRQLRILCSYHPSRQNTNTGKLTPPMFHAPFRRARELLGRFES